MFQILLEFAITATFVVAAGGLAICADQIAEITRLGHPLVGSVLLAGATSAWMIIVVVVGALFVVYRLT